jgi:hypothetical protein
LVGTTVESPRKVAQGFADHLNGILNRTVTDARLSLLEVRDQFILACLDGTRPASFALHGTTMRLLVAQTLRIVDDHCETLSYQYRFSLAEEKESWLIRWEYSRHTPRQDYPYPLAHVHINGGFVPDSGATLSELHIPTRRVPLELALWHLIAEWGVTPKHDDWQQVLAESIEGFESRRRAP